MPQGRRPTGPGRPKRTHRKPRDLMKRRPNQLYDKDGKVLMDGRDLCDCLDEQCPGCHFPCQACNSPKCGEPCRRNRMIYYSEVEVEGVNLKVHFPGPTPKPVRR